MNCFECAVRGAAVPAVATCRNCGAGLCLEHLAEAQSYRVGGTLFGCPHDLRQAVVPGRAVAGRAAASNGREKVLSGSVR